MCVTRVGRIIELNGGGTATVRFLDDGVTREVNVSMVGDVRKNSYIEVFAESALNTLTPEEAQFRKKLWIELRERNSRAAIN